MAGRERIAVAANDTLERVLEQLRSTDSADVVLEVDERSPLLISLQQLHSLDEVAQARGVQVAIASANSKLLNAARVFGLEVIDARAQPPPTASNPRACSRGNRSVDAIRMIRKNQMRKGTTLPLCTATACRIAVFPAASPHRLTAARRHGRGETEGWRKRRRAGGVSVFPASPRVGRAQPRHDPYGQPYLDDDEGEELAPTAGGAHDPLAPARAAICRRDGGR
jgi:hypothetical protein